MQKFSNILLGEDCVSANVLLLWRWSAQDQDVMKNCMLLYREWRCFARCSCNQKLGQHGECPHPTTVRHVCVCGVCVRVCVRVCVYV